MFLGIGNTDDPDVERMQLLSFLGRPDFVILIIISFFTLSEGRPRKLFNKKLRFLGGILMNFFFVEKIVGWVGSYNVIFFSVVN